MYYDHTTQQLRATDHTLIKTLHCPYKSQELNLYYKDARTLSCDTCQHQVLIAHQHGERELKQVLHENPDTCLLIDARYISAASSAHQRGRLHSSDENVI